MNRLWKFCGIIPVLLLVSSTAVWAQTLLSFEEYLGQVRQSHAGLKAAAQASQGADLRSEEGKLLLAPTVFGSLQYTHDEQPRLSPALQGNKSTFAGYTLGVRKLTDFGLSAALSYNVNRTEIFGADPRFTPLPEYYDAKPLLELSFPLWRNLFGAETRADQERIEAQALALRFEQSFREKAILADAEASYWRLAVAQAAVEIQKQSLARSIAVREWLAGQVQLQLTDRADLLQAIAAVRVRELEVAAAQDAARQASLEFNSLRGIDSAEVDTALEPLGSVELERLTPPERLELRDDVKAAQQRSRVAAAQADLGRQRISPQLELYSQVALNGRDNKFSESASDAFTTKYPYAVVGVRFSAPLSLPTTLSSREGYRQERLAAELDFDRRKFEQEQEWMDLGKRLFEAKSRLRLATEIVEAQKQKLEHERARHRRGRTTTYQVLLFEQDYASAALTRLQIQSSIIEIVARMRTFGGPS